MVNCHICGGNLKELSSFPMLHQVTSDCRPWKSGGKLAVCEICDTVQKPNTKEWIKDINEIYSGYEIYVQGNGVEQSTFDPTSGAGLARSQKIITWLNKENLPEKGSLLDLGCGNGSFLRAFGSHYPGWTMTGLELDERNKDIVESIKGVNKLHIGPLDTLDQKFDLIVLIHALEHITDPVNLLKSISEKLNPGGQLFVEVPDLGTSPFDLLIADHCSHFTLNTLKAVVNEAGYQINKLVADYVPKELSLLAKPDFNNIIDIKSIEKQGESIAESNIQVMLDLLKKGLECKENISIFGTSISATWIAASLGEKVSFFVDEDPNRIGRVHMNRKILAPNEVPFSSNILMPLRSDIADHVAKRLTENGYNFTILN